MLRALLGRFPTLKSKLRAIWYRLQQRYVDAFLAYDSTELLHVLGALGVRPGDTLMVHSGFSRLNGFKGLPSQVVDTLLAALGPDGNLLMVSMAYKTSAYEYLKLGKPFDVRKTVSHMGIISETFRRRPDVLRSLHPSNPVLALGPHAEWIVANHENCLKPCGVGSPFDKMAQVQAKILFYDASIHTQTFFHYLEDMVETQLDFPLFRPELMEARVIDRTGATRTIRTYAYSEEAIRRRRGKIMTDELESRGLVKRARIGKSRLVLIETNDVVRTVQDMASRGVYFYA
jgi:aminoglycoside 3-N-acetyltransferase